MTDQSAWSDRTESSLSLLAKQRSHLLVVFSHPQAGCESAFVQWYGSTYRRAVLEITVVLRAQHYEQHGVDITQGQWIRLPFQYLGLYEISVDGAEAARGLIEHIAALHQEQPATRPPATWLYYPASEKVGRSPSAFSSMLTVAFANGVPGQEAQFREWYATRHIRHALNIPALVSGQCFERTQFQQPGALEAMFNTIAVYEQEGTPESIIESLASLPDGSLSFPMLDTSRFSESVYRPV